ncbi:MAG: DsbA family protein [Candidatus Micrarchaeota archaeon]
MAEKEASTITVSKDIFYGVIILGLAGLLVLSIFTQGFGIVKSPTAPTAPTQPTAPTAPTQPTQPTAPTQPSYGSLSVPTGDYPALGQASAPVSFIEFSDFQCPFCGRLYTDALASIKTNYVNSGKVKVYFRDFPLAFHPNAMPSALAARCADEQDKFWEMHDKLFTTQASWSGLSDAGSTFKGYAADLGLDSTQFDSCYDSKKYESAVNADMSGGQSIGVGGTPANFLVIPKSKITESAMTGAVSSLNSQYGEGIELFVNSDTYVVLIPGAYPYTAFDAILSKVSY